jgi:hypothetical protein
LLASVRRPSTLVYSRTRKPQKAYEINLGISIPFQNGLLQYLSKVILRGPYSASKAHRIVEIKNVFRRTSTHDKQGMIDLDYQGIGNNIIFSSLIWICDCFRPKSAIFGSRTLGVGGGVSENHRPLAFVFHSSPVRSDAAGWAGDERER